MLSIDVDELAVLWTKAQPKVAAYISSLVRDFHAADDILQNVAAVVVRSRDAYDPQKPFVPWVIGIARLEVLKHRRSSARDRLRFDPQLIDEITRAYQAEADGLDLRREALAHCVQQVDGRVRRALLWRYGRDAPVTEIADHLEMSVGAVNVLLHRARKSLHDCIGRYVRREGATP